MGSLWVWSFRSLLTTLGTGRTDGYPTHYADQHSSASVDILGAGLILAFVILGVSLLSLLPSYNGRKRFIFTTQVLISLITGGIIVVTNYGQNWETAHVGITSPYKAGDSLEIKATLGLHIGLRGVNITLNKVDSTYHHSEGAFDHEDINYNEHFGWEGTQGRIGFGYYAAQVARDFRAGLYQGIPIPILQLAEYFTFDGEGIRFGRHYRIAGWYSSILMWTAFPCWLISSILFHFVVHYGALFLMSAGFCQLLALAVWYFNRNFVELHVPFEIESKEAILQTQFGIDFYFVLGNSIFCMGIGFLIFCANELYPDGMCQFFGIDPLTLYDEYHLSKDEIAEAKTEVPEGLPTPTDLEVDTEPSGSTNSSVRHRSDDQGQLVLKRRVDAASRLFQKSFRVRSPRMRSKPSRDGNAIDDPTEMTARTPLLGNELGDVHDYINEMKPRVPPPPPPRHNLPNNPPPAPVLPPRARDIL